MSWRPNAQVSIAGRQVAGEVLEVAAERGREDTRQQPRPGYARLLLLEPDAEPDLGDPVRVTVLVAGQPVPVFTGEVSDVEVSVAVAGEVAYTHVARITATGPLARVHRGRVHDDGYDQQYDGDRVAAVLSDALAARWDTVRDTLRWSDLDPARTWETFDPLDLARIDRPGVYELQANYADADPWRIAQQAANDGAGVIYETADGRIGYADSARRLAEVREHGYRTLPDASVLPVGLTAARRLGDVANRVELTYATGTVEHTDLDAVRRMGAIVSERVSTRLLHQADAQDRVELLTAFWSRAARNLERVELDLGAGDLTDAERLELLALEVGTPIRLERLPPKIAPASWSGFVEGIALELEHARVVLTLTVSAYELSTFGGRWLDTPPDLTWTETPDAVRWSDAEELIP